MRFILCQKINISLFKINKLNDFYIINKCMLHMKHKNEETLIIKSNKKLLLIYCMYSEILVINLLHKSVSVQYYT